MSVYFWLVLVSIGFFVVSVYAFVLKLRSMKARPKIVSLYVVKNDDKAA